MMHNQWKKKTFLLWFHFLSFLSVLKLLQPNLLFVHKFNLTFPLWGWSDLLYILRSASEKKKRERRLSERDLCSAVKEMFSWFTVSRSQTHCRSVALDFALMCSFADARVACMAAHHCSWSNSTPTLLPLIYYHWEPNHKGKRNRWGYLAETQVLRRERGGVPNPRIPPKASIDCNRSATVGWHSRLSSSVPRTYWKSPVGRCMRGWQHGYCIPATRWKSEAFICLQNPFKGPRSSGRGPCPTQRASERARLALKPARWGKSHKVYKVN